MEPEQLVPIDSELVIEDWDSHTVEENLELLHELDAEERRVVLSHLTERQKREVVEEVGGDEEV